MEINAYLKPQCGWSMGVRAIMGKYDLKYNDLDIVNNPDIYAKMVENYLLGNNLVAPSGVDPSAPTNSPCSDEEHAARALDNSEGKPVRFF